MPTEKPLSTQDYLARYEELDSEKKPWLIHFEALAEIFLTRKMYFTRTMIPGQFLQADVFDNTGQYAAYTFASVMLSMMWPDSVRTFKLKPAHRLKKLPGVEEYFRKATHLLHEAMDHPKAGLAMVVMEYLLDIGIFGTAGIGVFEGPDDDPELPVVYEAWDIKQMCLAENSQGVVDTVYFLRQLTVRQLVMEYSKPGDKIPTKVQELYDAKKLSEKVDVLTIIEPKTVEDGKRGLAGMPYRTVHIAKDQGVRMRVGGFEEMPIAVGRLWKSLNEPYGRSCGMIALPDAQSLNVLTEAVLVATEKLLDPPMGLLDDGRLGGGVVDTSAGALSIFNASGRIGNEKPIFQLQTVGELNAALEQQKALMQKIMQAFFLDRLLDLNNNVQMTAYETSVRDKIRGEATGGIFNRQEKEGFTPIIERTFNILFRKGYLGIIDKGPGAELRKKWDAIDGADKLIVPEVLVKAHKSGLNIFEIEYISPAKRYQKAEKLRGLMTAIDSIVAVAPVIPGVTDKIDGDEMADKIFELTGAPMDVLRTNDAVLKFRAANAKKAAEQEKMDQTEQQANIGLKAAQARSALGTAQPVGIAPGAGGK